MTATATARLYREHVACANSHAARPALLGHVVTSTPHPEQQLTALVGFCPCSTASVRHAQVGRRGSVVGTYVSMQAGAGGQHLSCLAVCIALAAPAWPGNVAACSAVKYGRAKGPAWLSMCANGNQGARLRRRMSGAFCNAAVQLLNG